MSDASSRGAHGWFPLCDNNQLADNAIYHTELHGHEVVAWRDTQGAVNVWDNRCPHRGVRLSLGHHRGDSVQCQYHGWQFGSGDGACRFVPAHRDAAPPPVAVATWPVEVRYGFVWTRLAMPDETVAQREFASLSELDDDVPQLRLRTVAIDAPADAVQRALSGYTFDATHVDPWKAADCVAFDVSDHAVMIESLDDGVDDGAHRVVFLLQPANAHRTYLHGVVLGEIPAAQRVSVLRHHQTRLNSLRDALEHGVQVTPFASTHAAPVARVATRAVPGSSVIDTRGLRRSSSSSSAPLQVSADARAFTVRLARSAQTVSVPAGLSLLDALRENGVDVPTSCEQGVCGTCRTTVLDGTPDHRDDYLTPDERRAGNCMMVCVSRAASDTLTLDL